MSRNKSKQIQRAKPASPASAWRGSTALRLAVGLLLIAAIASGGVWFWKHRVSVSLPKIELANFDPAVADVLRRSLDAVRERPRSADAWGKLGSLLRSYDLPAPALECLAVAGRLDPKNPRWPYFQSLLLNAQSPQDALLKLRRTVELCGRDVEAPRWRLATALAEAGNWDEAESQALELLRTNPEFTPALLLRARRAQARGEIGEAIRLAQRCREHPLTERSAWLLLAALHGRQGDAAAASEAARRASTLPPDESVADPYLAEAALLRPDARFLTEQTHPLLAAGRLREAEPLIQRLLKEHADDAETWLLAGRFEFLKHDRAAAEQSLRRHLELNPRSSQGLFQLGLVQLAQERFAEASETFLRGTQVKPDFGPAFYNRGFALARAGKLREAVPAFREAVRLNPERIDSYLMLGDLFQRLGEKDESAKMLRQAELLDSAHPGLRQLRSRALRSEANAKP